jgi:phage baseplate assembly protein W
MIIQKDVYTDLPMFISPNPFTGDLSIKKNQNAIQESVRNIVLTAIGERPFDRSFGTNIYTVLFEQPVLLQFYADSIISVAINTNEPRIRVEEIKFDVTEKLVAVSITYVIKDLDVTDSLVITLERTR